MTKQNFTYNDGGRAATGRKGSRKETVVFAPSRIALGLDYDA